MAYPNRPGHGRYTHTPPPPPRCTGPCCAPPARPCTGPCCAPPARGRGGNQPARGRGGYGPPPCTGPCCAPPARGRGGYQPARGRGGYQRYGGDVAAGLAIGAVGAAGSMSGYDMPAYQNLPIIPGVVATGTEALAAGIDDNNLFDHAVDFVRGLFDASG